MLQASMYSIPTDKYCIKQALVLSNHILTFPYGLALYMLRASMYSIPTGKYCIKQAPVLIIF